MTVYLDASVLVSLFVEDSHTLAARRIGSQVERVTVSHWTLTEASSALGRLVRTGRLTASERSEAEQAIERWAGRRSRTVAVDQIDFIFAQTHLRATSGPLRAPDALHLAIAARGGFTLATFDAVLAAAAREIAVQVLGA